MKESIEEQIKAQREEMDVLEPGDGLWARISDELDAEEEPKVRRLSGGRFFWQAAAVVFFALSSWLLADRMLSPAPVATANLSEQVHERLGHDYTEVELYYKELISQKQDALFELVKDAPDIKTEIVADMQQLEQEYTLLEEEFLESNNPAVVDAMIKNMRLRIGLLNSLMKSLNKAYNQEDEKERTI